MVMTPEQEQQRKLAAFHCQTGPSTGAPHAWTYLRDLRKNYRCSTCLVLMTKTELKELTDDA